MTVAVLVMELSIVSLLLGWVWVVIASSPWPAPWTALLAAPFALVGGRLVPYTWRRLSWFDGVWWAIVAVIVAVLAEAGNALAPGVSSASRWNVQFVAGLLMAWRAWALAEGWIDRELVESELQVGTVVVLGMLLMLVWAVPGAGLLPAVTFAAAGLVGIGLARRAERRDPRGGPETDWLVLVGGLVVVVVGVAGAVVALVTPDVLLAMFEQAKSGVLLAVSGIGALFQWLGSLFPTAETRTQTLPSGPGGGGMLAATPSAVATSVPTPPFWVFELFLTFVGVIFLIVASRAIYRLMRTNMRGIDLKMVRQREPAPPLSAPDQFTWRGWWRLVLRWLRSWLANAGSQRLQAEQTRDRFSAADVAEQRSIRALYRDLLTVAARAGFERRPSTTPNELAREVRTARPAASGAMSTATELYVRARYGEERIGREPASQMRDAVQQARRDLAPVASREQVSGPAGPDAGLAFREHEPTPIKPGDGPAGRPMGR